MAWTEPRTWVTGEVLTKSNLDAQVRDNLNYLKTNIALEAAVEVTIAAGVVTKTRSHHTIDTESDAATDDLVTINGGAEGEILLIRPSSGVRTIVLKHNIGNIWSPMFMDLSLVDADSYALLAYSGSKWCIIGAGGGSFTNLNDVPPSYSGQGGKKVAVKADATGLEFVDINNAFIGLDDAPATYAGAGGKVVAVNGTATELEFIVAPVTAHALNTHNVAAADVDFGLFEANNFCVEELSAEPALAEGRIYRHATSKKLYYCKEDS